MAGTKKRRKDSKMKMGECRYTKNGQKYCMTRNGVRFRKGRQNLGGSRRTSTRRGKKGTCKRMKRVTAKGQKGFVRRCAAYN